MSLCFCSVCLERDNASLSLWRYFVKINQLISEQSNNECHRMAPEQISNYYYSKILVLCSKQDLREVQNRKQSFTESIKHTRWASSHLATNLSITTLRGDHFKIKLQLQIYLNFNFLFFLLHLVNFIKGKYNFSAVYYTFVHRYEKYICVCLHLYIYT